MQTVRISSADERDPRDRPGAGAPGRAVTGEVVLAAGRSLFDRLDRPILVRHARNREGDVTLQPRRYEEFHACGVAGDNGRPVHTRLASLRRKRQRANLLQSNGPEYLRIGAWPEKSDFRPGRQRSERHGESHGDRARRRDTDGRDTASIDGVPDEGGRSQRRGIARGNVATEAHLQPPFVAVGHSRWRCLGDRRQRHAIGDAVPRVDPLQGRWLTVVERGFDRRRVHPRSAR